MLKQVLHHHANQNDCHKLCCTRIKNFTARSNDEIIFRDVNMHIHCGQITAIIGPNGAGKSTLLKCMLNQFPHSGELHYEDAKNQHTGHPQIGYVPQQLPIDKNAPTSVMDFFVASLSNLPIWLINSKKFEKKILSYLKRVKAEHLLHRKLGALSGGEMQRILLALSLNPMPDLLLLDEPVSGVDHNGLKLFYELLSHLRETEDMAIVLISHDLPLVAEYADQVILLNKKVVCSGTPQEVFSNPTAIDLFGHIAVPPATAVQRESCHCEKGGCC